MSQDFVIENNILEKYTGSEANIVIPEGVTIVSENAFSGPIRQVMKSVTIPEGVKEIERRTFMHCSELESVKLPSTLSNISWLAFGNCEKLKRIDIPEGVECIERDAFKKCTKAEYIHVPDSVMSIGEDAFAECTGVTTVELTSNLQSAKPAFSGCKTSVRIKEWSPVVSKVLQYCEIIKIYTNDFTSVPAKYRLAAALGSYEEATDEKEKEKARTYLAKNALKLLDGALKDKGLLSFLCENQLIKIKDVQAYLDEADKRSDTEAKESLLAYRNSFSENVVNKTHNTAENKKADYKAKRVERVKEEGTEKGIEGLSFVVTGTLSFVWKSKAELKDYLSSYGAKLGSSVSKKTDYLVTDKKGTTSDKALKAKELGVPIISEATLNDMIGKRYKDAPIITIPSWIKTISAHAFDGCEQLEAVSIPSSVQVIEEGAFQKCNNLKSISIPDSVTEIQKRSFSGCKKLESAKLSQNLKIIEFGLFENCTNLKKIEIPRNIEIIENGAFNGCGKLTIIVLPSGLKHIGSGAFANCTELTYIEIPDSVTEIGNNAFSSCTKLATVKLSKALKCISSALFEDCVCLTDIDIPSGVTCIERRAFDGCTNLTKIELPDSITDVDPSAFQHCDRLIK